jgi:hypothetical protein
MDMQDSAVIVYKDEDTGVEFHWHGGAYIDVGHQSDDGSGFFAEDVINVWNLGGHGGRDDVSDLELAAGVVSHMGRPFIRVLELFEQRCRDYINAEMMADDSAE